MSIEASRRFVELLNGQRELLLLEQEYWSQAARDPWLRARYVTHRDALRRALAKALDVRLQHLGAPRLDTAAEEMATIMLGLGAGLARERLIDPEAVPEGLLGKALVLLYRGVLATAQERTVVP
jgi:hypothetical protein